MTQYHGGKQRHALWLAKIIEQEQIKQVERTNKRYTAYVEPFLGMGSVMEEVLKMDLRFTCYYGNDMQESLIALWHKKKEVIVPKQVSREEWWRWKQSTDDSAEKAIVGFGCSLRGVYFGAYRDAPSGLLAQYESKLNQRKKLFTQHNLVISCGDYDTMPEFKHALIYCDPPYQIKAYYYNQSSLGRNKVKFDHAKFQSWCEDQVARNHNTVLVSEQSECHFNWPKTVSTWR